MTEKFDFTEGAQFDPGFIRHLNAFVPSIEYIYSDLHRVKNFNQKKMKFKMYYHKIINLIETYIGFYLGCILWAACIKDLDKPVLNNLCFGGDYDEKETIAEVNFVKEYIKQFEKDMKYYIGQDYKLDELHAEILDEYEEFLKINKGFTTVQKTGDIEINSSAQKLSETDRQEILDKIFDVAETGNFKQIYPLHAIIFKTTAAKA